MTTDPQGDPETPALDPDLAEAISRIAAATGPVVMALQQTRQALAMAVDGFQALYDSHAALLDWVDRQAVQPNWAQDRATLEAAKALHAHYAPEGPTT